MNSGYYTMLAEELDRDGLEERELGTPSPVGGMQVAADR